MPIPSSDYLYVERAYQRGDYAIVLAEGDAVAGRLAGERDETLTAPLAMMMGVAHAAYESNEAACAYLDFGVARAAEERSAAAERRATGANRARTANPPAPLPPMPAPAPSPIGPIGPYGVPTGFGPRPLVPTAPVGRPRRAGFDDYAELLLIELLLATGRTGDVRRRLPDLVEPTRAVTTRFAATRAQSAVAVMAGELETAHHFANTAAGLAGRVPSRFRLALVDADRALILARQGRGYEALSVADRVLGRLVRPVLGPPQVWSNSEGARLALALSRHAALGGDPLSAERLLRVGTEAAGPLGRHLLNGQIHLTRAVVAAEAGAFDAAEAQLLEAITTFHTYGYRPSAALAMAEQGRLAHRRGLEASARPLYRSALDELRAVGHLPDARDVSTLLAALDRGEPPPKPRGTAPLPTFPPTLGPGRPPAGAGI